MKKFRIKTYNRDFLVDSPDKAADFAFEEVGDWLFAASVRESCEEMNIGDSDIWTYVERNTGDDVHMTIECVEEN